MLIYNLLSWCLNRDPLILLYSASMAAFTFMMANLHGWSYAFIWPSSPENYDQTLLLSLSLSEVFLALFGMRFLELKKFSILHRLYTTYVALAVMLGITSFFISYQIAVQLLAGLAIAMSFSALLLATLLWYQTRSRDVILFFLAATAMIAGLLIYSLQKFGLLPVTLFTERAPEIGYIILIVLLALSLAERQNRERQARITAQDVLIKMQQDTNLILDKKVHERTLELEHLNKRLQEESTTDALTAVRNRRYFNQRLALLYQDAYRQKNNISLLLIDVDHFKSFNDLWGHAVGDHVLQLVANCMKNCVKRPLDTVYRYGGEEFAVLLPDTDKHGAMLIAEHIRHSIAELRILHDNNELRITISIGVTSAIPTQREGEHQLCSLADKALYKAKNSGRNTVCYAQENPTNELMATE